MELFILKLLDGMLGTVKNLFLIKNKEFLSALAGAIGTFFYLTMMVKLVKVNNTTGILLICLATFLGTYIPVLISNKVDGAKIYIFDVTPDTNENGKNFADEVRSNNIPILTYKGYNKNLELVVCCKIFSESKTNSKLIQQMIPQNFKYNVTESRHKIVA